MVVTNIVSTKVTHFYGASFRNLKVNFANSAPAPQVPIFNIAVAPDCCSKLRGALFRCPPSTNARTRFRESWWDCSRAHRHSYWRTPSCYEMPTSFVLWREVGNKDYGFGMAFSGTTCTYGFVSIFQDLLGLKYADGQTGHDHPCIGARSFRAHWATHNAKCFVRKTPSLALITVPLVEEWLW